jgi:hypothetical protein
MNTMRRLLTVVAAAFCFLQANGQLLTWTPDFPKDADNITITMDAVKGNQGLMNYNPVSDVYVHVGVITNLSANSGDWRYVKFTWATTPVAAQATSLGNNKWQYTISNIRSFFAVPAGETILRIAILFRNGSGSAVQRNTDGSDMFIPVYSTALAARFSVPPMQPKYIMIPEPINKQVGDNISITALSNLAADLRLYLNGTLLQQVSNSTSISASPTLTTPGINVIKVWDSLSSVIVEDSFSFFVSPAINVAPLPAGVRDGINYEAGNTSAVLVLYAPGKTRVSVIGEFPGNNWQEQVNYVMNKTADGNYWWLRITGLTPGTEYAFQYLVDGSLRVAEPYAEKILDPSYDAAIPAATYPGLRAYPSGQTGIVSILQTAAPSYNWAINSFGRPDKRNLVIYELLLRDFVAAHDWKTLRDTLSYLKRLGINAIELMPFSEYESNESWGYNPDFMFAPDKFYGPKNSLKEFIDSCHSKGIAVIMDMVLNHTTGQSPLAMLYWNSATNQPAANNPWLNITAKHPFNVFNDFNHESLATRYYSSRVMEHWLTEYKLDGYRFDLSKGFTQNANCGGSQSNISCWSSFDASRIAIWKRYYDSCQLKSPGSYVILEHFAENSEEIELSNYGMLLWGNHNANFSQAAMGYSTPDPGGNTWNFEGYLHTARNWPNPYLVAYMESHDEERMMYKNLQFGNSSGSYSTKDLTTALKRMEECATFFLAAPGPKLVWQFGELGYDYSINYCTDGTINTACRLDKKPIRWDYKSVTGRQRLYDIYSAMNKLRFHPWYRDVFIANNVNIQRSMGSAVKTLVVRSATDSSMLCVVGNFDVNAQTISFTFPAGGTWYDYLNGSTYTATGGAQSISLQPGEYHVLLNRNLVNAVVTGTGGPAADPNELSAMIFPNPLKSESLVRLSLPKPANTTIKLYNNNGQELKTIFSGNLARGEQNISFGKQQGLASGVYWLRINSAGNHLVLQFLIQ